MRAILSAAGTALGVLTLVASASAATLKVPQSFATIQAAVDAAADGDTILVSRNKTADGVYYEGVTVNTNNLKIIGKKAVIDGTLVNGSNTDCFDVYGSGVTIQGFTFRNGSYHIYVAAADCTVVKCVSRDANSEAFYVDGYTGASFTSCAVYGSGDVGIYVSGNGAVVQKCLVRQSDNYGIEVYGTDIVVTGNTILSIEDDNAIYLEGDNGIVTKNKILNSDGSGIYCSSNNAVVTSNSIQGVDNSYGVEAYGNTMTVSGNKISVIDNSYGIYIGGDDNVVSGNTITDCGSGIYAYANSNTGTLTITDNKVLWVMGYDYGIYAYSNGVDISGNSVSQVVNDEDGYYVQSYDSLGGGTIADNTVSDGIEYGFYFYTLNGVTISGNVAQRCGSEDDYGFYSYAGVNCTWENNTVTDQDHTGFYIDGGSGNDFVHCVAKNCFMNGFEVYGTNQSFTSCSATGCGGQGFDNGATGTVMSGGLFKGNRIDIANQVLGGGTFTGGLSSVTFGTGGAGTEPQVTN